MITLSAFSDEERKKAKILLAAKVASMMGRKLEEGDWSEVYCKAKGLPDNGWSNLHIDISHNGLGVEFKMLRIAQLRGRPLKSVCGTSLMHPAATRSIRIENVNLPANDVMTDVLTQYAALIKIRTERVRQTSQAGTADMRFGWLLWEDDLREFLYFEEPMVEPDPAMYYAEWNDTSARGARKASRSLWIYEKGTNKKRYSITTNAGIKIQPYFDVPPPADPHLIYLRVQSEQVDDDTFLLWVAAATAQKLAEKLGSVEKATVSDAIIRAASQERPTEIPVVEDIPVAVPIPVTREAFDLLFSTWEAVSDDHRIQLLLQAMD
jgi:hypothetical protein